VVKMPGLWAGLMAIWYGLCYIQEPYQRGFFFFNYVVNEIIIKLSM
jgi:hypothetical protein